ncbi:hypothetical protein MKJ04_04435 [Pontibacter sp. E15-1]|uniref:hypothetical protein n=1 Tax=Pontibacter sp. E15-1 TaxID=2919918 RepID=UPI001F4FF838|nr:hypothetical protein [Pontibacter sp. E15-1]MCJ8164078.1 hypothetical protein [Pontibacter sp. E15-1]
MKITLWRLVYFYAFLFICTSCEKSGGDTIKPDAIKPDEPVRPACLLTEINSGDRGQSSKYYYDANDKLLRIEKFNKGSNQAPYAITITYEYDAKGKILKANYDYDGVPKYYISYEYDAKGRLIKATDYVLNNVQHDLYRYALYEYTAASLVARKVNHFVFGVIGNTSVGSETYEYKNGDVSKIQMYSSSGVEAGSIEITYDDKASIYSSLPQVYTSPIASSHNIVTYELKDTKGSTIINNPYSVNSSTYSYEYNEQGFPIKQVRKDFTGRVLEKALITYTCK